MFCKCLMMFLLNRCQLSIVLVAVEVDIRLPNIVNSVNSKTYEHFLKIISPTHAHHVSILWLKYQQDWTCSSGFVID